MVNLLDPLGLFDRRDTAVDGSVIQKSTSIRFGDGFAKQDRVGLLNFGGESVSTFAPVETRNIVNEGDTITNISGSQVEGFSIKRLTSQIAEPTSAPTTSFEKPFQFAPNVAGSTTSATGEAEASSGLNLTAIALIGGLGFLGFTFLTKGRGRK